MKIYPFEIEGEGRKMHKNKREQIKGLKVKKKVL